jgi:hypothetical protein
MSGWPDPEKPGLPLNPERDGRHWLFDPVSSKSYPENWVAKIGAWAVGDAWTPRMVAEMGLHYQGPVLTPAEADTLRAEGARLRRGWLRVIQMENSCPATGGGCRAKRCGCVEEMEMLAAEEPPHD